MGKKISLFSLFGVSCLLFLIAETGSYFSDRVSSKNNTFTAGTWDAGHLVVNEVLFQVSLERGVDGKNEWIELYNSSSRAINLKGYLLQSRNYTFEVKPDINIPPKTFVLVSHDNDTWRFWDEGEVIKINLGGKTEGGWLENSGDHLVLTRPDGIVEDQLSYGNDSSVFVFPLNNLEGSISRIITGKDTDQAADFSEISVPTPGV